MKPVIAWTAVCLSALGAGLVVLEEMRQPPTALTPVVLAQKGDRLPIAATPWPELPLPAVAPVPVAAPTAGEAPAQAACRKQFFKYRGHTRWRCAR